MTLVCNASNFNVAVDMITFLSLNNLKQVCPNSPVTENTFPDGTVTRTGQTQCSLKILRPSLTYGGVYYCQVQPIHETMSCFDYTSSQVEVLIQTIIVHTNSTDIDVADYYGAYKGALIAVGLVSFALVLLVAVLVPGINANTLSHTIQKTKQ